MKRTVMKGIPVLAVVGLLGGGVAIATTASADANTPAPVSVANSVSPGAAPSTQPPATQAERAVPCVKHLPKDYYRSVWAYNLTVGRPHQAQAGNLSLGTKPRSSCEQTVGSWGGPGYDGTHLIAATLKGTSQRFNLVPATQVVNRTIMKSFENAAKKCLNTPGKLVLNYTVTAFYKNGDREGVVPTKFTMSMVVHHPDGGGNGPGDYVIRIKFQNKKYTRGGAHGITNRLKGDVTDAGCTGP